MGKKLGIGVAAATLAAGMLTLGTSAAASPGGILCMTADATPVYASYSGGTFSGYLYTIEAGRGVRVHSSHYDGYTYVWHYGHGADHPDSDGYMRGSHLPGC